MAGYAVLQRAFGKVDDFFDGKFVTSKDPDAVAEFYQAEDLLQIISIHPFIFNIVMGQVEADAEVPTEETALISLEETHVKVKLFGFWMYRSRSSSRRRRLPTAKDL
eukprot:2832933-Prymnesium_polylepis.1